MNSKTGDNRIFYQRIWTLVFDHTVGDSFDKKSAVR
jgi:hypothetical protein